MLELTVRDPNSLLSIVYRQQITAEQLEAIRTICERNALVEVTERRLRVQSERRPEPAR